MTPRLDQLFLLLELVTFTVQDCAANHRRSCVLSQNITTTINPPPPPALMLTLFNNLDSISPCRQVHSFTVIHCPNLNSSSCTKHFNPPSHTQKNDKRWCTHLVMNQIKWRKWVLLHVFYTNLLGYLITFWNIESPDSHHSLLWELQPTPTFECIVLQNSIRTKATDSSKSIILNKKLS